VLLTVTSLSFGAIDDLITTISNPVAETNSKFGFSVDGVEGDILAGAPLADIGATDAGIAYRFQLNGSLIYPLENPIPNNGDQYGFSLEGFDKNIIVGAPLDEVVGASSGGAVHLHRGSDGGLLRSIASPAPLNNARFGWSVYTLKGKFVAGAPNDVGPNDITQAGAAYLLSKGNKGGNSGEIKPRNPKSTFLSPRATPDDEFGFSVSALKNVVVVGAPSDDATASNAGAAYVFDARTAAIKKTLDNPEPGLADQFGYAVAAIEDNDTGADGNKDAQIAVGAPGDENTSSDKTGRVFVFDSTSGQLQFTIEDPDPQVGARFGASVHDAHGRILVGAPGQDNNSGIAYLFNGQTGELIARLQNPNPEADGQFGFAVSKVMENVKGPDDWVHLIVGAPGQTVDGHSAAGNVYVFRGFQD
jgi:hypothetical protein